MPSVCKTNRQPPLFHPKAPQSKHHPKQGPWEQTVGIGMAARNLVVMFHGTFKVLLCKNALGQNTQEQGRHRRMAAGRTGTGEDRHRGGQAPGGPIPGRTGTWEDRHRGGKSPGRRGTGEDRHRRGQPQEDRTGEDGTGEDRHRGGQAPGRTGTEEDRQRGGQAPGRTGIREDRHRGGQTPGRTGTGEDPSERRLEDWRRHFGTTYSWKELGGQVAGRQGQEIRGTSTDLLDRPGGQGQKYRQSLKGGKGF